MIRFGFDWCETPEDLHRVLNAWTTEAAKAAANFAAKVRGEDVEAGLSHLVLTGEGMVGVLARAAVARIVMKQLAQPLSYRDIREIAMRQIFERLDPRWGRGSHLLMALEQDMRRKAWGDVLEAIAVLVEKEEADAVAR